MLLQMHNKHSMWVHVLLCALVASAAAVEDTVDLEDPGVDPRIFFIGNTTGLTVNLSTVIASAIGGLALLILLAGLAYLFYLLSAGGEETGYSGHSGYGHSGGSGSSGYSARSAYVPPTSRLATSARTHPPAVEGSWLGQVSGGSSRL